jgi:hypothetical protein
MPSASEPLLTIDEAYRAAWRFIAQYATREPVESARRFRLLLGNMELDGPRQTCEPAAWHDWVASVDGALASTALPFPDVADAD